MKINPKNNFVRIFKVPHDYPNGFCFGGGRDINFIMVDWFSPYPEMEPPVKVPDFEMPKGITPLYECPNHEIELTDDLRNKLNSMLSDFIRKKNYNNGHDLLAITNYGDAFIIKVNESKAA